MIAVLVGTPDTTALMVAVIGASAILLAALLPYMIHGHSKLQQIELLVNGNLTAVRNELATLREINRSQESVMAEQRATIAARAAAADRNAGIRTRATDYQPPPPAGRPIPLPLPVVVVESKFAGYDSIPADALTRGTRTDAK